MGVRRVLLILALAGLASVASAENAPRLKSSWTEKDARVLTFSPDGRALVSSGGEGHCLRDAATGRVRAVLAAPRVHFSGARFSPDSRILYAEVGSKEHKVATEDLHVWDVATGQLRTKFAYVNEGIGDGYFALSRDGRLLAFRDNSDRLPMEIKTGQMGMDGRNYSFAFNASKGLPKLTLWDVERAERRAQLDGSVPLAFSPDGKTLVTGDRDWRKAVAKVWDTSTGKLRAELKDRPPGVWPLVISPDGRFAAAASHEAFVLWQLGDGTRWRVAIDANGTRQGQPVFSPDGKLFFPLGLPWIDPGFGQKENYYAFDLSVLPPRRIDLGPGELIFASDGRRFASARGERGKGAPHVVVVFALPDVQEIGRLEVTRLNGGSFSPDGRWLALLAYRDEQIGVRGQIRSVQEIHLVDTTAARIVTVPSPGQTWGNYGWRFSPDGNSLAVYYRTGTNVVRAGEPDPSERPMNVEIWDLSQEGGR